MTHPTGTSNSSKAFLAIFMASFIKYSSRSVKVPMGFRAVFCVWWWVSSQSVIFSSFQMLKGSAELVLNWRKPILMWWTINIYPILLDHLTIYQKHFATTSKTEMKLSRFIQYLPEFGCKLDDYVLPAKQEITEWLKLWASCENHWTLKNVISTNNSPPKHRLPIERSGMVANPIRTIPSLCLWL